MSTGAMIFLFILFMVAARFWHIHSITYQPTQEKLASEMAYIPCPAGCGREMMAVNKTEQFSCMHCWMEKLGEQS